MPAATPLHVLRLRLLAAEAAVRAADQALATCRERAASIPPTGDRFGAHLEELEGKIREAKERKQTAKMEAAEAGAQAARCARHRAEVMALVQNIEGSTST